MSSSESLSHGRLQKLKRAISPYTSRLLRKMVRSSTWSWKIDGLAIAILGATLLIDRTGIGHTRYATWASVIALFALGLLLRRHLKRDIKWRDLRRQVNRGPSTPTRENSRME
jgi:hypothetical protein